MSNATEPVQVVQVVDVRGLQCPMPVVKLAQAVKQLQPGQVLELLSTDPGVEADMPSWASRTGNELLSLEWTGTEYRIRVRRR